MLNLSFGPVVQFSYETKSYELVRYHIIPFIASNTRKVATTGHERHFLLFSA